MLIKIIYLPIFIKRISKEKKRNCIDNNNSIIEKDVHNSIMNKVGKEFHSLGYSSLIKRTSEGDLFLIILLDIFEENLNLCLTDLLYAYRCIQNKLWIQVLIQSLQNSTTSRFYHLRIVIKIVFFLRLSHVITRLNCFTLVERFL